MPDNDLGARLREVVAAAAGDGAREQGPFQIIGGGTKSFLGREASGAPLPVSDHRGILDYQPKELVITARCGTRLAEIEAALAARGQMLPFEPPHFDDRVTDRATLGGCVATGLSGPRRPYVGSARDAVLGARLLNGRGEILRFGGQVVKNVAGYDVSRLMVGALGTLGILLEASVKVVPMPAEEITLVREHTLAEAIESMNRWAARPLPLSGACFDGERLIVRLSGNASAIRLARERLGGELLAASDTFWRDMREQRHGFFAGTAAEPLWRLATPPAAPPLPLAGRWLLEWGGGQRWLRTDAPTQEIRAAASALGGHATLFRGGDRASEVFHPLEGKLAELHARIKHAFDPHGLFNPGRLYSTL
uniref:Glycolate oxidase FAD binding subunit n=1 Tax=Candidatus Kentrum sp. LPFa TaxID=2126335 RepID=A0A450XHB7_9GAMM|nr:MAG: glycolate oxidase FAD binding subunit [Candidatus Kentron sp. LPFa]VFK28691.1 MAG: glycolate oxidase FAD binding subunit [Candidatus Kentron sp. LPFa]